MCFLNHRWPKSAVCQQAGHYWTTALCCFISVLSSHFLSSSHTPIRSLLPFLLNPASLSASNDLIRGERCFCHSILWLKKNQWINLFFLFCSSFMVVGWSLWYFLACEISSTPTDSRIYFLVVVYQNTFRNQAWVTLIIQFIYNLPDDSSQHSKQKRRHPVSGLCHNRLDLCNTWS